MRNLAVEWLGKAVQNMCSNSGLYAATQESSHLVVYKDRVFDQVLNLYAAAFSTPKTHLSSLLFSTFPPYPQPLFKQLLSK